MESDLRVQGWKPASASGMEAISNPPEADWSPAFFEIALKLRGSKKNRGGPNGAAPHPKELYVTVCPPAHCYL